MGRPSLILTRRRWPPRARASTLRAASRAPTTRSAHEALNGTGRSALSSDQSRRSHTWTSREVKSVQDRPHGPSASRPVVRASRHSADPHREPVRRGSPARCVSDRSVWAAVLAASNPDAKTCRTAVRSSTLVGPGSCGMPLCRSNPSTAHARPDGRSPPLSVRDATRKFEKVRQDRAAESLPLLRRPRGSMTQHPPHARRSERRADFERKLVRFGQRHPHPQRGFSRSGKHAACSAGRAGSAARDARFPENHFAAASQSGVARTWANSRAKGVWHERIVTTQFRQRTMRGG